MPELPLPFAVSLIAALSVVAAVVVAAALGAVIYAIVGRRPAAPPVGDGSVAGELRAIGAQIEKSLADQRHHGETQRQMLAQKFEDVRETVEAQGHEVGGLRNEVRHEVRRRDAEMEEIRQQIATLHAGGALPAAATAALPAHEPDPVDAGSDGWDVPSGDGMGYPAPSDGPLYDAHSEGGAEDDLDIFDLAHAEQVDVEADTYGLDPDDIEAVVVAEQPNAAPTPPPADDRPARRSSFEVMSFDSPDDVASDDVPDAPRASGGIFTPVSFDAPDAPPADSEAWVARTGRADVEAQVDAERLVETAFAAPAESPVPDGAEDLTRLDSIDPSIQDALYAAGLLTLDDIARIGRSEALRLEQGTGVSADVIMSRWVFEAQDALFEEFSGEAHV